MRSSRESKIILEGDLDVWIMSFKVIYLQHKLLCDPRRLYILFML